ncbi:MAG TPA: hypothetical protein QF353_03860 [Gammaproteobacteria bacterium]|nr:hypothetical protein [Gammaproteobacteria bacterium]
MNKQLISTITGAALLALGIIGYCEYRFSTKAMLNDHVEELWADSDEMWTDIDEIWDELSHLDSSVQKHEHHSPHTKKVENEKVE